MINRKFIVIIFFIIISCKKDINDKQETTIDSITLPVLKNEVIIKIKDSIVPFTINILNNINEMKPELIYIGRKKNELLKFSTDSILNLVALNNYKFRLNHTFLKGDTIYISQKDILIDGKEKVKFPYYTISSERINPYELNFDYYVSKKTPTIETYPFYKSYNNFLNRNKFKFPLKYTFNDVFKNTLTVLDSLFFLNKITKKFYLNKVKETQINNATYQINTSFLEKKKIDITSFNMSLSDTLLYRNKTYLSFLKSVIRYKYFFNKKKRPTNDDFFKIINNKDTVLKPKLKLALLNITLKKLYRSDKKVFLQRYEEFKLLPLNSEYINFFEIQFKKEKEDKKFQSSTINSTGKLKSLKNSKKFDFQEILKKEYGKVVLVDFWASWCAPCRKELPSLRILQKEIDSSKFAVISISTDDSFSAWKRASEIEQLDKKPHNYLLINSKKSELIQNYKIFTIPRYLLFDYNGQLINDDAPRPSNPKLKKSIYENLKKK